MHEGCAVSKAGTSNPANDSVTNGSPNAMKESSKRSSIHELYKPVMNSVLEVVIEKPATVRQKLPNGSYEIRQDCPGVALIINIREFACSSLGTREGAEYDAMNMFNIWKGLGYKIFREDENLWEKKTWTREEVLSTIKAFREYCRQRKPDSIVVFIGSHGQDNAIYTSDPSKALDAKGREIPPSFKLKEEIFCLFYDRACLELVGKPKVFLINACQEFYNESDQVWYFGSPVSDMFIYLSQAPGFVSFRSRKCGSWFVHCLTFVIMKMAKDAHLNEMIKEVKNILHEQEGSVTNIYGDVLLHGQAPVSFIPGAEKLLYFPIQP